MQSKKPSKSIALQGKWTWLVPILSIVVFAVVALFYLGVKNADMLFMVQSRSLFINGSEFYTYCTNQPGGFILWLGSWLTQLFYEPWLGASVLVAIWVATFFVAKAGVRMSNIVSPLLLIPLVCLLVADVHCGYWIYYLKHQAFFFREALGLFGASLLILGSWRCKHENFIVSIVHILIICILAGFAFAWIGFYAEVALLAIAGLCISKKGRLENDKPMLRWIGCGIALATAIVAPLIWGNVFTNIPDGGLYLSGMPYFEAAKVYEPTRTYPFYIASLAMIAFAFVPNIKEVKGKLVYAWLGGYAVLLAGSVYIIDKENYAYEDFHAECQAYRAIDEQRWNDVLIVVGNVQDQLTRELIVLKNIALFNTGDAGNSMYHYDDLGIEPETGDSLRVAMNNIASPLIFFHHGMFNFAYRWSVENSVEYGYSFDSIKLIALISLINGEYAVAEKYLDILSGSLYYKDWANRYRPALKNHKLIKKFPELKHVLEINAQMGNYYDSDAGLAEKYIMHYFSNTQNHNSKYMQEMTLAYAMMTKDIQTFWPRYLLYLYLHKGEKIPIHYQEAAYMYGCLEPQSAPDPAHFGIQFDQQNVINRYQEFQRVSQSYVQAGMNEEQIAANTKSQFGDTFWWAYFFNRHSHYY